VLRIRKRLVNCVGRFSRHVLDRTVVPIGLAAITDNQERKGSLSKNQKHEKNDYNPGAKS